MLPKILSFVLPIFPGVPEIDPETGLPEGWKPAVPGEENVFGDILEGIGDFFEPVVDGITSIADLVASAFEGAKTILGYIADFNPSFDVFADLLPGIPAAVVGSVLAVMATVITFKVVGYFT